MKRPLAVAAAALLAAILLQPAVASVHEALMQEDGSRLTDIDIWLFDDDGDGHVTIREYVPLLCEPRVVTTNTTIDEWPDRIDKARPFRVGGVVRDAGSTAPAPGVPVTIYLNETKSEPGAVAGRGVTGPDGRFDIEGRVPSQLPATSYNLVAEAHRHETRCVLYLQSWSDPELDVVSGSTLALSGPDAVPVGVERTWTVILVDDTGVPVADRTVTVDVAGARRDVSTDATGRAAVGVSFPDAGERTIAVTFDGDDHYGAARVDGVVRAEWGTLSPEATTAVLGAPYTPPFVVTFPAASANGTTVSWDLAGTGAVDVTLGNDGRPVADLGLPTGVAVGDQQAVAAAPFLKEAVVVPVPVRERLHLMVDAPHEVGHGDEARVTVRAVDDAGAPVAGIPVTVDGAGAATVTTAADGTATATLRPACGEADVVASFAGDRRYAATSSDASVAACPVVMALTSVHVGAPLWAWLIALLALVALAWVAWRAARRGRDGDTAPDAVAVAAAVPAVQVGLQVVEPADDDRHVVGVGERLTLRARVDGAPRGARVAFHVGARRVTEPLQGGVAEASFTVDVVGERVLDAQVLDPRDEVLARANGKVRVVRYAEEVERAYRRFLHDADVDADRATPRRLAAAWHARHPDVAEASLWRLVTVFETADYSQHPIDRATYLAFARADRELTAAAGPPRSVRPRV